MIWEDVSAFSGIYFGEIPIVAAMICNSGSLF